MGTLGHMVCPCSNEKPYGYELILRLQRRMNNGKKLSI